MSLPSFPEDSSSPVLVDFPMRGGTGDHLPVWLLACCGAFTAVATGVSIMSITLQLKNYRKPPLQRAVVRIMLMVPLYALSSLIALFSLEAAFFIDAVRDLYEAFVIYTFFQLLITYLGGERSLLIILHGRPPIPHPFPVNIFLAPMDVSDPWTLLNLKRGVLQYVQVKPLLVVATVILKATGTYQEGRFASDSGYTYISIVYNTSICLSLYCLAMFWVCVAKDLKPFRPVPKFLCVKGILFFSFWQSIFISLLVAAKAIKKVGPYTDAEHMSLALVDSLICFEMPIFAIAHQYAFRASDYIDENLAHAARLPYIYAMRDAFGFKDVWQDIKDTARGRGVSYQAYEPAEGALHYGAGRQKRIRAGLRYSRGGQAKYWLPLPGDEARHRGDVGPVAALKRRVDERLAAREGYAPLLPKQAARVVHDDPAAHADGPSHQWNGGGVYDSDSDESDAPSLDFDSVDDDEDALYERARRIGYAGFPNVDVSREQKKRRLWEEEEGILKGRWSRNGARSREGSGSGRDMPNSGAKGKGKDRGMGVYGAWADRVSPVDRLHPDNARSPNGRAPPLNGTPPPRGEASDEWLYDGDNERPKDGHGDPSQLRWTQIQLRKSATSSAQSSKPPSKPSSRSSLKVPSRPTPTTRRSRSNRPTSPFVVGDEEDSHSDPEADEPVSPAPNDKPLPRDAVDLVVEDERARQVAEAYERRKGEPQTKAPAHIYRANRQTSDMRVPTVQEVYTPEIGEEKKRSETQPDAAPFVDPVEEIERIEEAVMATTPGVTSERGGQSRPNQLYHAGDDENPWA